MFDNNAKTLGSILLAGAAFSSLAGCSDIEMQPSGRLDTYGPVEAVDLGEGIYQLPARDWPASLPEFRRAHQELEIVDTQIATTTGHGDPTSFVLITKPVQKAEAEYNR